LSATLATAYGLPPLLPLIARCRLGPTAVQWTARLAFALSLLWLSLEIRHAFRARTSSGVSAAEGEWYAYSAAGSLRGDRAGAGLYWRAEWLRRAALAGIGIVALKVFVSDMAELTGGCARSRSWGSAAS